MNAEKMEDDNLAPIHIMQIFDVRLKRREE